MVELSQSGTVDRGELREAIRALDEIYIEHGNFGAVLEEVREVISFGASASEAICLQIGGPPGSGKSTLRRKLAIEYPIVPDGRNLTISGSNVTVDSVPVLQLEIPDKPTVSGLCYAILDIFGEHRPSRAPETILKLRVSRFLTLCGTQAILIDEAQRIVDKPGAYAGEHILDFCKWIHARHGIPIIFLGLGRLRHLFEEDFQLDRRWNAELRLDAYNWKNDKGKDDIEQQSMFIAILVAFREMISIPFSVDVEEEAIAFRFYCACQGLVGVLKKLLREAIRVAFRRSGSERKVSMEVLEEAFSRSVRTEGRGLTNPFSRSFAMVLPPKLVRDDELLPSTRARSRKKTRKARKLDVERVLTKS